MEDERGGGARRAVSMRLLAPAGIALLLAALAGWFLLSLAGASPSGQLEADCVNDQQAISEALANGDAGKLRGAATGDALLDLTDQVIQEQASGLRTQESRKLTSIEVVRATDPQDPAITQAVEMKGVLTRTITANGSQSAEQQVNFDDRYWLRAPNGSRYAITDRLVSEQPVSGGPSPLVWAAGAAVVALSGVTLAIWPRGRTRAIAGAELRSARLATLPESPEPNIRIGTLGGLRVWVDGIDLAPRLKRHPMLCFIWIWLLLRAVHYDRPGMSKADLGDEAYPGSNPETQRTRLRGRLSQIRTKLPAEVGGMVLTEGDMVRLDLSGCRVDVTEMKRTSERVGSDLGSAADSLVDAGLKLFEASRATVLPEWDGIARQIARGRGGADDLIRDVREATLVQRSELGRVLADVYQRRGESSRAAAIRRELGAMISADEPC